MQNGGHGNHGRYEKHAVPASRLPDPSSGDFRRVILATLTAGFGPQKQTSKAVLTVFRRRVSLRQRMHDCARAKPRRSPDRSAAPVTMDCRTSYGCAMEMASISSGHAAIERHEPAGDWLRDDGIRSGSRTASKSADRATQHNQLRHCPSFTTDGNVPASDGIQRLG